MCHCGSTKTFKECCEPYLLGNEIPATAEALMRSRYSAFIEKNFYYILHTTDPQTREKFDQDLNKKWAESVNFTQLEIIASEEKATKGKVEFIAHFLDKASGQNLKHHELSTFRQQSGVWYYRDGKTK